LELTKKSFLITDTVQSKMEISTSPGAEAGERRKFPPLSKKKWGEGATD